MVVMVVVIVTMGRRLVVLGLPVPQLYCRNVASSASANRVRDSWILGFLLMVSATAIISAFQ